MNKLWYFLPLLILLLLSFILVHYFKSDDVFPDQNIIQDVLGQTYPYKVTSPLPEIKIKSTVKDYKVAIQAGHWKAEELPEELAKLRSNQGATLGGQVESDVNLNVAIKVSEYLKNNGIDTEILPATVPPGYIADAFVAIHADQSSDQKISGFKASPAINNKTPESIRFCSYLLSEYQKVINMPLDGEVTINMTKYYAFNNDRFEYSINDETPAVIFEMGFLSNQNDQIILIEHPEIPARGISNGIIRYLNSL